MMKLGMVVVFRDGVDEETARTHMFELARLGVIEYDNEECSRQPELHAFDPARVSPVWSTVEVPTA